MEQGTIDALDKRVDAAIPHQPLLCLSKEDALISLLVVLEDKCNLCAQLRLLLTGDTGEFCAIIKSALEAFHHAVSWVEHRCPSRSTVSAPSFPEQYAMACSCMKKAEEYSRVWDVMSGLYCGIYAATMVDADTVELTRPSGWDPDIEIANLVVAAPDEPGVRTGVLGRTTGEAGGDPLFDLLAHVQNAGNFPTYSIPTPILERLASFQDSAASESLWEFPATWELGVYSVAEFRQIYRYLVAFAQAHAQLSPSFLNIKPTPDKIVVRTVAEWRDLLSSAASIAPEKTERIIKDLTRNPDHDAKQQKKLHVNLTPFFRLGGDLLALSNVQAIFSNAERNIWEIVERRRPELTSRLKAGKESVWLEDIRPRLETLGFRTAGPRSVEVDGDRTDLDLVILDDSRRTAVTCELKWLKAADSVAENRSQSRELKKGQKQASLCLGWLERRDESVAQFIGVSPSEIGEWKFHGLVLSRSGLGGGGLERKQIPVLTERVLFWVLENPLRLGLKAAWIVGSEFRFRPHRGKHFVDNNVDEAFGGVKFIGRNLGFELRAEFDPTTDIDWTGLDENVA
jgi:hypothetical protein